MAEQKRPNLVGRQHQGLGYHLQGGPGHLVHRGQGRVLDNGEPASIGNGLEAPSAIVVGPGEDDADG